VTYTPGLEVFDDHDARSGPSRTGGCLDSHGEPVAWVLVGEPVIGTLYGTAGPVAYTHFLTIPEAIDVYGPVSEWVVGPQGGFRSVCFGTRVFSSANSPVVSTPRPCRRPGHD